MNIHDTVEVLIDDELITGKLISLNEDANEAVVEDEDGDRITVEIDAIITSGADDDDDLTDDTDDQIEDQKSGKVDPKKELNDFSILINSLTKESIFKTIDDIKLDVPGLIKRDTINVVREKVIAAMSTKLNTSVVDNEKIKPDQPKEKPSKNELKKQAEAKMFVRFPKLAGQTLEVKVNGKNYVASFPPPDGRTQLPKDVIEAVRKKIDKLTEGK